MIQLKRFDFKSPNAVVSEANSWLRRHPEYQILQCGTHYRDKDQYMSIVLMYSDTPAAPSNWNVQTFSMPQMQQLAPGDVVRDGVWPISTVEFPS